MKKKNNSLFDKQLVNTSLVEAFRKLDPRTMIKNPIMFTVELVTAIMLLMLFYIAFTETSRRVRSGTIWRSSSCCC